MVKISIIIETNINFKFDEKLFFKLLNIKKSAPVANTALKIANDIECLPRPKYILKKLSIDNVDYYGVTIASNRFRSKILAHQLQGKSTVFAFIATCGKEIFNYAKHAANYLENYIIDQVAYMAYLTALEHMQKTLEENFKIRKYTSLTPGSLLDWNVEEVKKVFSLFDGAYNKIGVDVLDSGLINPLKSTSGLLFKSNEVFHSCSICMKINCPNRRSEFDEKEYNKAINI